MSFREQTNRLAARVLRISSPAFRKHMATLSAQTGRTIDYDKMTATDITYWNAAIDEWERKQKEATATKSTS